MNNTRAAAITAAALAAALTLSGCGQHEDSPASPPPCPKPVRMAGGDLVPDGARPCILSTPRPKPSSTRTPAAGGDHRPETAAPKAPGPTLKTPAASKAPKSPSAPKSPAKAKAPEKAKVPDVKAPAATRPRR
ncbi:hypothetical protein ACFV2X_43250 [Streptomyces sp. NPDC059679]|uniref:hypothetical protein n=1 Tax=Streptomyces sp. NPDC059679 TaxID=3346903 RepID=UPI0036990389